MGGHTRLQEEHLQACLREAHLVETSAVPPNPTLCLKLVDIIQLLCETGSIPTELVLTVLVLIPKVNSDTRVSGFWR